MVEFPADQKYEIGVMEGCEYGDLLVNDTTDVYFTNITGPVKYVAADSVGADSAKVTLRVGIIPAAGTNIKQKGKSKKVNGVTASYCSINAFVYDEYGTGSVDIKSGCENYICDNNYTPVPIKFNSEIVSPNYSGWDECNESLLFIHNGVYLPLFDSDKSGDEQKGKLWKPYKILAECYSDSKKSWQYNVYTKREDNTNIYDEGFYFRAIKTVCLNLLKYDGKRTIIKYDYQPLDDDREIHISDISSEKVCEALQDFEYNRPYPTDPIYEKELENY